MGSTLSSEDLMVKFFNKLYEVLRNGGREDLINELLKLFDELLKLDKDGSYSTLCLFLLNLSEESLKLSSKDKVRYFINSHKGLTTSFKKILKVWIRNQRELIDYLESSGNAEHPLANIFIVSEILGLLEPSDPESYVIRGDIYLNYLKVLKEYEAREGFPLKVQAERAFKNALELYSKAVSIDVNCCEGYLGLARLYVVVKDLDQALKYYESALMCRNSCDVIREVAEVYFLKGDRDVAYKYLKECVDVGEKQL